ncbi:ubiquitin carboxyl-terminal hydrolase MINDY-3-like [Argopecten irradians]|uniref:ubiquitin carboxyl-terminal hydrolase MINDY-3-like n=1 Tax=Argopecten irradians TaxID=31199 RepID=UPI003710D06B
MAMNPVKLDQQTIQDVRNLLWGSALKDEIFTRWTQGFSFSEDEPTALVQHEGGPCAIIAPVQAYVLRAALFKDNPPEDISAVTEEEAKELLCAALTQILIDVASSTYRVVSLDNSSSEQNTSNTQEASTSDAAATEEAEDGERSPKRPRLDEDLFHSRLRCTECEDEEALRTCIKSSIPDFTNEFGVLLHLYSVVLTKGIEQIKNEVEDPGESLIDCIHGHGSQSLINLFLSGKAVTNVWDNDKEVCGLKLHGIPRQATIGFLTLLEHMRYCEVGWYLKNPRYPIWLLGSETHLTVLFSKEENLVVRESPHLNAKQIFQSFDPEGNGFISTIQLADLMSALNLVSEKEYVDIMTTKLDAESLGIITMHCFMEEFYPGESTTDTPRSFTLYHYNGLARSCIENKVRYQSGKATIPEELDVQIITDVSTMKMCLETKWPTIEVTWNSNHIPSLN